MTAPNVIWAYSASCLSFDDGEWDQSEIPQCGPDWPHASYIRADAPELLALVDAMREVAVRPTLYTDGGELDWLIDDARNALQAYEALK